MSPIFEFDDLARLAATDDNVAIATRQIEAGTQIQHAGRTLTLSHTILVGHRFVIRPIAAGDWMLSWGQPFGRALRDMQPGEYIANAAMLRELARRSLDFPLPEEPNFDDSVPDFVFDAVNFTPADPLPPLEQKHTFMGFRRKNGSATRNFIVLLGTSSLTAGFVRALENRLAPLAEDYANIDGIVAVAHTEGAHRQQNNRDLLLRTLAGFMVHPNVGAVLAVDYGSEAMTNAILRDYMNEQGYSLDDKPHHFMSVSSDFEADQDAAGAVVRGWLDTVNQAQRVELPLSEIKLVLQCGGSDAFSGVSGNPLAGWVAKQIIRAGGSANLAETDELVSAESYVLNKVRDAETAERFLATIERFKTWAGWHGHAVTGNPSGGNLLRGLYNIYLKSLGAAAKRDPDVPLDYVIDYGQPMTAPGYYFMDSPGNDLESIAGQVASGGNMIYFVTGNGSITNFPFVPTLKIMTTTPRYELLHNEMDVNAGRYLDGMPLDELGAETLDLTLRIASGERSAGERAGHAQVQLWRNWSFTQAQAIPLESIAAEPLDGQPLPLKPLDAPDFEATLMETADGLASDQIGLIMPTSLCAGQVGLMIAEQLNAQGPPLGISRFVALAHTEGCGYSGTREYPETIMGYATHPLVARAVLLEHGCESTHNGYLRGMMVDRDLNPNDFGWASIQLDGGIEAVTQKVTHWFATHSSSPPRYAQAGLASLRIALMSQGDVNASAAQQLTALSRMIVSAGGTVILPDGDALLKAEAFAQASTTTLRPTLNFARTPAAAGFHIMDMPTSNASERITGLGAAGVEAVLIFAADQALSGHPLVPVLTLSDNAALHDADLILQGEDWPPQILALLADLFSRRVQPRSQRLGNVDFQVTRGLLGVSL